MFCRVPILKKETFFIKKTMNFVWNHQDQIWNVTYQGHQKKFSVSWNQGVHYFFRIHSLNHEKKMEFIQSL